MVDTSSKYKKEQWTLTIVFDYNVSFFFGKVHCNVAWCITRLHKGSIHIIKCLSCTCAPLFAVHCPFPVSSFRASVHSQQRFFPPTHPLFWLEHLFSSSITSYVPYIFQIKSKNLSHFEFQKIASTSAHISEGIAKTDRI